MMLKLYHHNISVCAQKVRLLFEEKEIRYCGVEVDLMKGEHTSAEYLKINPKGLVPALDHDGQIITESTVILEYLEDVFPDKSFRPDDPVDRAHMRAWAKIPDDGLHVACGSITYAAAFVHQLRRELGRDELARRLASLPDRARAERQQQILDREFEAPFVRAAVLLHDKVLAGLDERLREGEWLVGTKISLADIALFPYILRLDRLGLEGMWADRPSVGRWLRQIMDRPSFDKAITAYAPGAYNDELRKQGIDVWPQVRALLSSDGRN